MNNDAKALIKLLKKKEYLSHIYLRKTDVSWPFGLYTMLYSQSKEKLALFIQEIAKLLGNCRFKVLNTLKEFKKTSFNPYLYTAKTRNNRKTAEKETI